MIDARRAVLRSILAASVAPALLLAACARSPVTPAGRGSGVVLEANEDARFFWEEPRAEHRSLVPLDELVSGGPDPDGIPPIDAPTFEPARAVSWLDPQEPVLALEIAGDSRAYPLQILLWHEIVNDVVGARPVVVTYCPLCNSGIVFDRTVAGAVTTFGTSGRLYRSDLVMYDRTTKSLWPQFMGKAVVGPRIGTELERISSQILPAEDFRSAFPDGKVLSRDTGFDRDYGTTPYEGYDTNPDPFLFDGDADPQLPAIARVVGVRSAGGPKAYPIESLRALGARSAVNDEIGSVELVVLFERGTRSVLDAPTIAGSRDVGTAGVFSRRLGKRVLTLRSDGSRFRDDQTGSTWDLLGRAIDGPLKGERLTPVESVQTFWFAWSVFVPDAPVWTR